MPKGKIIEIITKPLCWLLTFVWSLVGSGIWDSGFGFGFTQ